MLWVKPLSVLLMVVGLVIFIGLGLFNRNLSAASDDSSSMAEEDPYGILNHYRKLAGMPLFHHSELLTESAANHVHYLNANPVNSTDYLDYHHQLPGRIGFTGVKPSDRALHVGYPSRKVSENISTGSATSYSGSISSLMSAIYHRFGFLDFTVDEIGIARDDTIFVYDMGNRQLSRICTDKPEYFAARSYLRCGDYLLNRDDEAYLCRNLPDDAIVDDSVNGLKCANGTVIDGRFIRRFCESPPEDALLHGPGSYYFLCDDRYKVKKDWLDSLCRHPGVAAYRPLRYFTLSACPEIKIRSEWREDLCAKAGTSNMDEASFYPDICHTGFLISVSRWEESEWERLAVAPDYVVWPARDYPTPTRFTSEFPDPLPDLEVTGYPISVHFNPYTTEDIRMDSFSLHYLDSHSGQWMTVNDFSRLDHEHDPNNLFTPRQFAWFPIQPLYPGTTYRVDASFTYNGKSENLEWTFVTTKQ